MTKSNWADVLERAIWTGLQTVTAVGIITFFGWPEGWIVPVAAVLAFVKSVVASQFGNGTAATLPASLEPTYEAAPE